MFWASLEQKVVIWSLIRDLVKWRSFKNAIKLLDDALTCKELSPSRATTGLAVVILVLSLFRRETLRKDALPHPWSEQAKSDRQPSPLNHLSWILSVSNMEAEAWAVGILAEVAFHKEKEEDIHRKESRHMVKEDIHTEEEVDSHHKEITNTVDLPFPYRSCHPSSFISSYCSFRLLCVCL